MGKERFEPSAEVKKKPVEAKKPVDKEKQERHERRKRLQDKIKEIEGLPNAKHYCKVVEEWCDKYHSGLIPKEKSKDATFSDWADAMIELYLMHDENKDLVDDIMGKDPKKRDMALIILGERTLAEMYRFEKEMKGEK